MKITTMASIIGLKSIFELKYLENLFMSFYFFARSDGSKIDEANMEIEDVNNYYES